MPFYSRKKAPTKYARKAKPAKQNLVATIKQVVKNTAETKAHILPVTEQLYNTVSSSIGVYALNTIVQGDTKFQREGAQIMPTFIDIRGQVQATHQEAIWYKIMLIEHNSARDPTTDLFEDDTGTFGPPGVDLKSIYARVNTGKYKVLGTKTLKTGTVSNTANDANAVSMFTMSKKLTGKMYYDEGSNVPNKRQLSIIVFGRRANNDETTGKGFELTFNSKIYYKDI